MSNRPRLPPGARLAMLWRYVRAVEAAAASRSAGHAWHDRQAQLEQLASVRLPAEIRLQNLRAAPRCEAIAKSTGKRCRAVAVSGTTRCAKHGGRRRAPPSHPANVRALRSGLLHRATSHVQAWTQWGAAPPHAQRAVLEVAQGAHITTRAAGVRAYLEAEHDGGRAWRQWLQDRRKRIRSVND